jgi:hypothetical protein
MTTTEWHQAACIHSRKHAPISAQHSIAEVLETADTQCKELGLHNGLSGPARSCQHLAPPKVGRLPKTVAKKSTARSGNSLWRPSGSRCSSSNNSGGGAGNDAVSAGGQRRRQRAQGSLSYGRVSSPRSGNLQRKRDCFSLKHDRRKRASAALILVAGGRLTYTQSFHCTRPILFHESSTLCRVPIYRHCLHAA